MPPIVAPLPEGVQLSVSPTGKEVATVRGMATKTAKRRVEAKEQIDSDPERVATLDAWLNSVRERVRQFKAQNDTSDAAVAAELEAWGVDIGRSGVNAWWSRTEPTISQFYAACVIMGADPGMMLFGRPILTDAVPSGSAAHKAMSATPASDPKHEDLMNRIRSFKRKKASLRRGTYRA